jgi:hypothetical protein
MRRTQALVVMVGLLAMLGVGCNEILGLEEGKPYPPDGGSSDVKLTGTFVGGAVEGTKGSVALRGRIAWRGAVQGKANGVELKGWLE